MSSQTGLHSKIVSKIIEKGRKRKRMNLKVLVIYQISTTKVSNIDSSTNLSCAQEQKGEQGNMMHTLEAEAGG